MIVCSHCLSQAQAERARGASGLGSSLGGVILPPPPPSRLVSSTEAATTTAGPDFFFTSSLWNDNKFRNMERKRKGEMKFEGLKSCPLVITAPAR